jgi:hypothetical protein
VAIYCLGRPDTNFLRNSSWTFDCHRDDTGKWTITLPIGQDSAPGTIAITAIRNAAGGDWIQLAQTAPYTVRPPMPALSTFVSPSVLQLPAAPGTQWIHAANMKNQRQMERKYDQGLRWDGEDNDNGEPEQPDGFHADGQRE